MNAAEVSGCPSNRRMGTRSGPRVAARCPSVRIVLTLTRLQQLPVPPSSTPLTSCSSPAVSEEALGGSWLQLMGVTGGDHRRLYIQPLLRSVPAGSRRLLGMSECSAGIRAILRPYLVVREGDRMHARRSSRAWRAKYGQEVPTRPLEPVYGARAVTIYNY